MKIVIEIPEEIYKSIQDNDYCGISNADMFNAIVNGIPLPKGHGRLIDADRLRSMYSINLLYFNTVVGIQKWVDNAPTIIEAERKDKE